MFWEVSTWRREKDVNIKKMSSIYSRKSKSLRIFRTNDQRTAWKAAIKVKIIGDKENSRRGNKKENFRFGRKNSWRKLISCRRK